MSPARRSKGRSAREAAILAARLLDAGKGGDVVVLDVGEVSPIAEYFVLASGSNARHVRALVENLVRSLKDEGIRPDSVDGAEQGSWAVADYGPVVVHVFLPDTRALYDLELLWGDGSKVRWRAPAKRAASAAE
jgi:ribosome-associated protein